MDPAIAAQEDDRPTGEDLRAAWPLLTPADRFDAFRLLRDRQDAEDLYLGLSAADQADLLHRLPAAERKAWIRALDPDDAADVLQAVPEEEREALLAQMETAMRKEVTALLAFAEDDAGGLMNPRFARVRPDMRVEEALQYLRVQARERLETIYYAYVLDAGQHLLGVVSLRQLFVAAGDRLVREVMQADVVSVREEMDQEAVSRLFAEHDLVAIPVVDAEGRMRGIVTVDDIVDVVQEEATEDIQRMGGSASLDAPYLETPLGQMVRKRAGWLAVLFLGEMLTATAMAHFEEEISRAMVLVLFVPLIVSSGGNSGSQASTLVVRAMALGEVRVRDWWRVARREVGAGLALGLVLGSLGFGRIIVWQQVGGAMGNVVYGPHYVAVAAVVGASVVGVVLLGTVAGSMLPFVLRRLGFDPATASAPFVATLVDVGGLVIFFSIASLILSGRVL